MIAKNLNFAFECLEMIWSPDSGRFVAVMHREYEHDDVRVTDLWLFGPRSEVCRLTATPRVEESGIGWLDERRVIFTGQAGGLETVLEVQD